MTGKSSAVQNIKGHQLDAPKKTSPMTLLAADQKYDNLLVMISQERKALLQGPKIMIVVNEHKIMGISKRAAMAASFKLNRHFTAKPYSTSYTFNDPTLDPNAVHFLLKGWMNETCQSFEAKAVGFQATFARDLAVLRAARILGMERYTMHILAASAEYLRTTLPTYEEIDAVIKHTASDKEPVWTNMVNHLCHVRHFGNIPDPEDFAAYLNKNDRLKKSMEVTDEFFKNRQLARKAQHAENYERRQQQNQQAQKH